MHVPYVRSPGHSGGYVDLISHLMENRILFIGPELTTEMATLLSMQMLVLAQETNPISIYINCYGGSVPAGLAVMDVIGTVGRKVPVHTYCVGECIGIALVILTAGAPGHRWAFPSARFSLYQEWYGVESLWGAQSQDHDERSRLFKIVESSLRRRTNLDRIEEKTFHNHLTNLAFFDAEQARAYGIIDEIHGKTAQPTSDDRTKLSIEPPPRSILRSAEDDAEQEQLAE